jgi:hypothetical protein
MDFSCEGIIGNTEDINHPEQGPIQSTEVQKEKERWEKQIRKHVWRSVK